MISDQQKYLIAIRILAVFIFVSIAVASFANSRFVIKTSSSVANELPTPTPSLERPILKSRSSTKAPTKNSKYANFGHKTHLAVKIECSFCHKFPTSNWEKVRSKESAFPDVTDYPRHESCITCHRQQFFSGKSPAICSNCHTNPSPTDSSRHPFSNPRENFDASAKGKLSESGFQISFPHDKHIEIVSKNSNPFIKSRNGIAFVNARANIAGEESCAVCHQTYKPQDKSDDEYFSPPPKDIGDGFWLKKGTFKTGPANHATCFTCHSTDTGILPAPTDCATCHKLKLPQFYSDYDSKLSERIGINDKELLLDWRRRDSSGTFRHEWFSHSEMSCNSCHDVLKMNTTDFKTRKVAISSCDNCHITATLFDGGVLNTEVDSRRKDPKFECVKCHLELGKLPIPDSHLKAIPYLTKVNP